jgi:hypothetical protein
MKKKNIIICITLKKDEVIDEDEYMNIKKREKHVKKTLEYHKLGKKKKDATTKALPIFRS